MADERVLCVPRAALDAIRPFSGFACGSMQWLGRLLSHDAALRPRTPALEADESWLQLVAYVVLRCEPARGYTMAYSRSGGDDRLDGKASIGSGGHVDESDCRGVWPPHEALRAAALRELDEEVTCDLIDFWQGRERLPASRRLVDFRRIGLIFDPSDPVGRVHLGVVYQAWVGLPLGVFAPRAPDRLIGWATPDVLRCAKVDWESWSRILLDELCREPAGVDVPAGSPRSSDGNVA